MSLHTLSTIIVQTAKLEDSAPASHIAHSTVATANGLLVHGVQHHAHEAQHHAPEVRHHALEVLFRAEKEDVPHQQAATVMCPFGQTLGGDRTAAVAGLGVLHVPVLPEGHRLLRDVDRQAGFLQDGMTGMNGLDHHDGIMMRGFPTIDQGHHLAETAMFGLARHFLDARLQPDHVAAATHTVHDLAVQTGETTVSGPTPVTSQNPSRRSSPRPASIRGGRDDRSRPQSPQLSPKNRSTPLRDQSMIARRGSPAPERTATPVRSPPRGPAALRQPPSGPSGGRNFPAPSSNRAPPAGPSSRNDIASLPTAPAGPRGYVPTRGGFGGRGGRGGWGQMPSRHPHPGQPVSPVASGPSNIPTGPRSASISSTSGPSPVNSKPFNPPTGPSSTAAAPSRPTLAQSLMNTMTPVIPGGKLDPSLSTLTSGLTKEVEPHTRKLKEEEERVREEMRLKQERLRKNLRLWDKLERDTRSFELKSDLSERSLKNLAGEGLGGAAF
ncbi:hypothetical protein CONLIGDRAFT_684377 [Coniochaeta ligniaria NRRL 30616]|uniref:Uncharacterized protein n=1 Tax=Coniochaeta ligniaria NRRL 30616 TaxID=1408157 RepID=A0A1J7IDT0_9PEZI|nr:hypothetical protein CONLIGDRAFT_684377 [Coniochaeta ligniaria NRRL 30616]